MILDCTLRDGGYYTNWDFSPKVVATYIDSFNKLPIDYLEIGYRSNYVEGYLGEFFYCPLYLMKALKARSNKKLVIILNEKDVRVEEVKALLIPCIGYIAMIRLAIDPKNFKRALGLAEEVKKMGFEVGFNVMYMSTWKQETEFLKLIPEVDGLADYFYMVDSYGGVFPDDVKETFQLVKAQTSVKLGFHGHNNLELALINTLTAIGLGVDIVDSTITGMGRGAGNLKTELLLTALNANGELDFDFNALSKVVDVFSMLQKEYEWGTNLPYMVSGANSLPQKEVMDWVSKRYFSFNSIIRALSNQSKGLKDNRKLERFSFSEDKMAKTAMVIGGGMSVNANDRALREFLIKHPECVLIHASSKNALNFRLVENSQYFCLVGNEGHRLEDVFDGDISIEATCILPPFPRAMGTYIPSAMESSAFELDEVSFTDQFKDSHTALALQIAIKLGVSSVFLVGYDGYSGVSMGIKEQELFLENEYLFEQAHKSGLSCISLTKTSYNKVQQQSLYALL